MTNYTDTQLLDFLQALTNRKRYTGLVLLRESIHGRGWRLMETTNKGAVPDVRQAITNALNKACRCRQCESVNVELADHIDNVTKPPMANVEYTVDIWRCLDCGHHWDRQTKS